MKLYINSIDASSYLISCSDIPLVQRNRTWSPIFSGFRFSVSGRIPMSISKNLEILFEYDEESAYYLGYIAKSKFNYNNYSWDINVNHYLMKLEPYKIIKSDLHDDLLDGITDWTTPIICTFNTSGWVEKVDHGLADGTKIQFRTTGVLPVNATEYASDVVIKHNYYVKSRNADSFYIFENFADYSTQDVGASVTNSVPIISAGTGVHTYTAQINNDLYNDWGYFIDSPFDIHAISGSYEISSYVLPESDTSATLIPPYFNLITFFGDGLPSPLVEGRSYIVGRFASQGFRLYENLTDYWDNIEMDIPSGDESSMSCSIVLRYGLLNGLKHEQLNVAYDTPFVALKYLIKTIFAKIGCTLDTTDIDNIVYMKNPSGSTSWKWNNVLIFENMLYNLNQSTPIRPELITEGSDYGNMLVNCLQFVQFIFGKLGIQLKYTGSYAYKLISQKRTATTYYIDSDNENWYDIDEDDILDFNEEIIAGEDSGGYTNLRYFPGVYNAGVASALCYDYNNRPEFVQNNIEMTKYNVQREGSGRNNIEWYDNLLLFLINQDNGSHSYPASSISFVVSPTGIMAQLYDLEMFGNSWSILKNEKNAFTKDYIIQEIECRALELGQNIWTCKEINFNIENRRIKLIQERTL